MLRLGFGIRSTVGLKVVDWFFWVCYFRGGSDRLLLLVVVNIGDVGPLLEVIGLIDLINIIASFLHLRFPRCWSDHRLHLSDCRVNFLLCWPLKLIVIGRRSWIIDLK